MNNNKNKETETVEQAIARLSMLAYKNSDNKEYFHLNAYKKAARDGAQWQSQNTAKQIEEYKAELLNINNNCAGTVNDLIKQIDQYKARIGELEDILAACGNAFRQIQRDELLTPSSEALISKMLN